MAVEETARRELIAGALEAAGENGEKTRVPWQGSQQLLPVIRIKTDGLVLNPRSHRIRAQLESNPNSANLVKADPEGDEAQVYIADILRKTDGFQAIKDSLKRKGQEVPGIITRDGRLINANTRAVALRDLGVEYIEVAVLPKDAQPGEIYDLELELQVAEDVRQPYTFTNDLLFIEDMITQVKRSEEQIALRLGWATSTKPATLTKGIAEVRRYVRYLTLIRAIQKMSGQKIPLTEFDDAKQALYELDVAYENLRNIDPPAAEKLKQGRILGLLVDLGYDRQRLVDVVWIESHLTDAFDEQELLGPLIGPILDEIDNEEDEEVQKENDDLDLFDTPASVSGSGIHRIVDRLVNILSTSTDNEMVTLPTNEGPKQFKRIDIKVAVNDAMRTAAEDAKAAKKAGNALNLPSQLVNEAISRLNKARTVYEKVKEKSDFSDATLRSDVEKLARAIDSLNQSIGI